MNKCENIFHVEIFEFYSDYCSFLACRNHICNCTKKKFLMQNQFCAGLSDFKILAVYHFLYFYFSRTNFCCEKVDLFFMVCRPLYQGGHTWLDVCWLALDCVGGCTANAYIPCCLVVHMLSMQGLFAFGCQVQGVQIQGFQMPDVNAIGKWGGTVSETFSEQSA